MMAYANEFVVSIKADGNPLREIPNSKTGEREVFLRDGSEYSIFLKNKTPRRAVAHIFVDGTEVVQGGLVVPANSQFDLLRFVVDGNPNSGNKFKFVAKDGAEGHKLDDPTNPLFGQVEVKWFYEVQPTFTISCSPPPSEVYYPYTLMRKSVSYRGSAGDVPGEGGTVYCTQAGGRAADFAAEEPLMSSIGGTVTGSSSNQQFTTTHVDEELMPAVIIRIRMRVAGSTVAAKGHIHCSRCGQGSPSQHAFCWKCGELLTHGVCV